MSAADPDWIGRSGPATTLDASGNGINAMAFSADGHELLVDTEGPSLFVLDGSTGKALKAPMAGYRSDAGLAAPAGSTRVFVASWSEPRSGKLVSVEVPGKSAHDVATFAREPALLAASANGARVALAYVDDTVQVFDAVSGRSLLGPLKMVKRKPVMGVVLDHVKALALSADGARLALGVEDGPVHVFDSATGKGSVELDLSAYHGVAFVHGSPKIIAFSSDGARIVTFEQGGNFAVHDATTGKPLGPLVQIRASLTAFALGRDGKTAFSGDAEGHLQRWTLDLR